MTQMVAARTHHHCVHLISLPPFMQGKVITHSSEAAWELWSS